MGNQKSKDAKIQHEQMESLKTLSNTHRHKKYLVVVRHGERLDETALDISKEDHYDTQLTENGKTNSKKTGYQLARIMNELGLLKGTPKKVKYLTSIFYRCLQTTASLREGVAEFVSDHEKELEDPEAVKKALLKRKTHVEEACSEKIKMLPTKYTDNLRIHKDPVKVLTEFAAIKPVHRSLFDYDEEHQHYSVRRVFDKSSHIYEVCFQFYKHIIKRLQFDASHDVYIVVAHGMYVQLFLMFLELQVRHKVQYNSVVLAEFDFEGRTAHKHLPFKLLVENKTLH